MVSNEGSEAFGVDLIDEVVVEEVGRDGGETVREN